MLAVEKCKLCGAANSKILGIQNHEDKYLSLVDKELNNIERKWLECNNCSFIYRSPMIDEKQANILYSKYRSYDFRKISPIDYFQKLTTISDAKSETFEKALYIKQNIDEINSVLDVGCGGGIFLFQLMKIYPEAYFQGLEPNEEYAKMVSEQLDIAIVKDFYKEGVIDRSFDLTVSTDVIEHIHDVDIFWKVASKNIIKGKYLFLEIPSYKNFKTLSIEHEVFESPHLYFFKSQHIDMIAKKYNFEIVSNKEVKNRDVIKDWIILRRV